VFDVILMKRLILKKDMEYYLWPRIIYNYLYEIQGINSGK